MISFEEAINISLSNAHILGTQEINFSSSLGYILSEDIISDINMPPFNKSAMDGYACRKDDIRDILNIVEIIPAGVQPKKTIQKGECAQIMTGAIIPEGADTVLMVEHIEKLSEESIRFLKENTKSNICYLGEDIQKGAVVLNKGKLIKAQDIAVMASVGATLPKVYQMPRVAVIATGTELVEPYEKPGISKIRNSNGSQMMAQLAAMGIQGEYYGIAPDHEDETFSLISRAMAENDLILLSGGVSMGRFDFVPGVLKKLGFDILFDRVAVQPGKPTTFGINNGKYVFGLPGNPVSSFIIFELFVKAFIYKLMNYEYTAPKYPLKVEKDIIRKKADRMGWIPVTINSNHRIENLEYHGSAHINALCHADGLIYFEKGQYKIEAGDLIYVRQI